MEMLLGVAGGVQLRWLAVLLLVPLAVVLAYPVPLFRYLDAQLRKAQADAVHSYWSFRKALALSYDPYRATAWVCAYAAVFAAICMVGVWVSGGMRVEHDGSYWHIYLDEPSPFAAALNLAVALLIASIGALVAGVKYGGALRGTGLFAVIWLVAGAIGCLFGGAIVYMPADSHLLEVGGAFAFCAALWLLAPRPGGSTLSRAQRAGVAAEERFAVASRPHVPQQGVYEAPYTRGIWRTLQSVFFVPTTVLRFVRWDENGIEVGWLGGEPSRYRWDELERVEVTEFVRGSQGAKVTAADGRELELPSGGRNYDQLLSVLEAHIWARDGEALQD